MYRSIVKQQIHYSEVASIFLFRSALFWIILELYKSKKSSMIFEFESIENNYLLNLIAWQSFLLVLELLEVEHWWLLCIKLLVQPTELNIIQHFVFVLIAVFRPMCDLPQSCRWPEQFYHPRLWLQHTINKKNKKLQLNYFVKRK